MFVERYRPVVPLPRLPDVVRAEAPEDLDQLAEEMLGQGWRTRTCNALRSGMYSEFLALAERTGRRRVLLPAQICVVVRDLVQAAGFEPVWIDCGETGWTPRAEDYVAKLDSTVAAVVVAPFYGHLPGYWAPLVSALDDATELILDMAQGLGLEPILGNLLRRASVVGYSFGVGKGIDCGGGMVLSRRQGGAIDTDAARFTDLLIPLGTAIAARVLGWAPLSRLYSRMADAAADQEHFDPSVGRSMHGSAVHAIRRRLSRYLEEVGVARQRADDLGRSSVISARVDPAHGCFDTRPTHLRQIVRLRNRSETSGFIERLRGLGVDCAAAGEPLPVDPADAPFATQMRETTVRLGFLGRISPREYEHVVRSIEHALG